MLLSGGRFSRPNGWWEVDSVAAFYTYQDRSWRLFVTCREMRGAPLCKAADGKLRNKRVVRKT